MKSGRTQRCLNLNLLKFISPSKDQLKMKEQIINLDAYSAARHYRLVYLEKNRRKVNIIQGPGEPGR